MLKTIEQLQKKPESSRRYIAFWVAFSIVVVIFGLWILTLTSRSTLSGGARGESTNQVTATPLRALWRSAGAFFDTLERQIKGIEEYEL